MAILLVWFDFGDHQYFCPRIFQIPEWEWLNCRVRDEEFGENGYETCSLTYYTDDILLNDSDGTVIPDPEGFFGDDWRDHFGDYEDDAIHFRNDEEGVDYEILKSEKSFHEVYRDPDEED